MTRRCIDTLISMVDVYNQQIMNCDNLNDLSRLQKERSQFILSIFRIVKNNK
jgi:hypothetical protein